MESGVEGVALLTIFVLSAFTGYEVISKVSTVLHTPLLSGANAITGVLLVGAIIVAAGARNALELTLALIAVALATATLVGGFVVTDRMLHMFSRGRPALGSRSGGRSSGPGVRGVGDGGSERPANTSGAGAQVPQVSAKPPDEPASTESDEEAPESGNRVQRSNEQGAQRDD